MQTVAHGSSLEMECSAATAILIYKACMLHAVKKSAHCTILQKVYNVLITGRAVCGPLIGWLTFKCS